MCSELYDICTLSYVLSELATPKVRRRLLRSLWSRLRVGSVLAIIEPGMFFFDKVGLHLGMIFFFFFCKKKEHLLVSL